MRKEKDLGRRWLRRGRVAGMDRGSWGGKVRSFLRGLRGWLGSEDWKRDGNLACEGDDLCLRRLYRLRIVTTLFWASHGIRKDINLVSYLDLLLVMELYRRYWVCTSSIPKCKKVVVSIVTSHVKLLC